VDERIWRRDLPRILKNAPIAPLAPIAPKMPKKINDYDAKNNFIKICFTVKDSFLTSGVFYHCFGERMPVYFFFQILIFGAMGAIGAMGAFLSIPPICLTSS